MKDVDLRGDIYSLGCTLFHMLAGQPPYVGSSSAVVLMMHMSSPVADLRKACPECTPELEAVGGKMMQKRPADRPQGYEEVIAELQQAYEVSNGAIARSRNLVPRRRGVATWAAVAA